MPEPLSICHIITTTSPGGAEKQLVALAANRPDWQEHAVICLSPPGELAPALEAAGAPVRSLGLRPGPAALLRGPGLIRGILARTRPHIVQTWLYHADLLGALGARLAGIKRLIWTVRCADMDFSRYALSTRLVVKACTALSSWPAAIVANSRAGAEWHLARGYKQKPRLIPNGFDTGLFRPDAAARETVRRELGIPPQALAVGRVARLDAMKDYPGLLRAAQEAIQRRPELFFILAGQGVRAETPELRGWLEPPLAGRALLLGPRRDVPRLLNALDLHLSNSLSEGMPNVVGEAMAVGLPNLVSDAGDSRELVGETGWVVPAGEPPALAEALAGIAGLERGELSSRGQAARRRIIQRYSLEAMVQAYSELYRELSGGA
ncbi:hypothetical protein AAU61_01315 [Desulfocarbo indianensis]|nr:hypothetical protein AAU61_01315 [Desulfocarbo indianensis]